MAVLAFRCESMHACACMRACMCVHVCVLCFVAVLAFRRAVCVCAFVRLEANSPDGQGLTSRAVEEATPSGYHLRSLD